MEKKPTYEELEQNIRSLEAVIKEADRRKAAEFKDSLKTLAGAVSHEINNILAGIVGYADLIMMDTDESDPNYSMLKRIKDNGMRGSRFTSKLLGYARSGRYNETEFNLNDLVMAKLDEFNNSYAGKEICLDLYAEPLNIVFDKEQLSVVINDLYTNAAEATEGKSDIFVRTGKASEDDVDKKPGGMEPGRYALLEIEDKGTGMDEMTRSRIFQPFFTTKSKGSHIGMSLASAYQVISESGGYISFSSEKDSGTRFSLYLKLAQGQSTEEPGESSAKTNDAPGHDGHSKYTILVADDEKCVRESFRLVLGDLGYDVITAEDGTDALLKYERSHEKIGMAILDRTMPNMDGFETFYRLKEKDPGIKVLVVSGLDRDSILDRLLDDGAVGFVNKPFDVYDVADRVKKAYGLSAHPSELKNK